MLQHPNNREEKRDVSGDFASVWQAFNSELDARHQRLCSEIEASWKNLDGLLRKHAGKVTAEVWGSFPKAKLSSILDLVGTKGSIILFEPLLSLRKARSQERALSAIENYQTGIEDVLRLLPQTITVSRRDLAGHPVWKGKPVRRFFLRLGRQFRTSGMRAVVRQALLEHSAARAKWDGRILLLLARATLSLLIPWQFMRNHSLRSLGGGGYGPLDLSVARDNWPLAAQDQGLCL
jgi:hypothetical protein